MLSEIVQIINSKLKPLFKGSITYGITEMIPVIDDTVNFYPFEVKKNSESVKMAIDNTVSLQIYHRLISKQTQYRETQYGNNNKDVTDVYQLSMYVIGNRNKLSTTTEDTSLKITGGMPDVFTENGKQIAIATLTNVDFNSVLIINAEFPNTDYSGLPDIFMIRHDYLIRHSYKRNCITCETECKNYSTN